MNLIICRMVIIYQMYLLKNTIGSERKQEVRLLFQSDA